MPTVRSKNNVVESKHSRRVSLIILCLEFFLRSRVYMACLAIAAFINMIAVGVAFYTFLEKFEARFIIQYGPVVFGVIFTITSSLCLFLKKREVLAVVVESRALLEGINPSSELTSAFEERRQQFIQQIMANIILAAIAVSSYVSVNQKEQEAFFLTCKLLMEFFPQYALLPRLYLLTLPVVASSVLLTAYVSLYVTLNGYLYAHVMVKKIKEAYSPVPTELLHDREYQSEVYKNMVTVMKMHVKIYEFTKRNTDDVYIFIIVWLISGFSICASIIVAIIHGTFTMNSIGRLTFIALTSAHIGHMIFTIGQGIQDEFFRFMHLISTAPWYCWSIHNQKAFVIFTIATQKYVTLSVSPGVAINYEFALTFVECLYSFTTMLLSCMED